MLILSLIAERSPAAFTPFYHLLRFFRFYHVAPSRHAGYFFFDVYMLTIRYRHYRVLVLSPLRHVATPCCHTLPARRYFHAFTLRFRRCRRSALFYYMAALAADKAPCA